MRSHMVVGGWAAGLTVLAIVLAVPFDPGEYATGPLPYLMYLGAAGVVAAFGVAVLLTRRAGRAGVQQRQPMRATTAVHLALAMGFGLLGLVYGWYWSVLAAYPLGAAIWTLRGERLPAGTDPWPVASDEAAPAGPPGFVYRGSSVGTTTPVPADHAAHGPPAVRPPPALGPVRRAGRGLLGQAVLWLLRRMRR
ncbi:MAG: hypothetical protein L0H64_02225 [Pseudonocardia sp.]|nr:hypothetical protein [Pseudonocardia sp.]